MSHKQPFRCPFKEAKPPDKDPDVTQIGEFTIKSPNEQIKKFKSSEMLGEEQILDYACELSGVKISDEVKKSIFTKESLACTKCNQLFANIKDFKSHEQKCLEEYKAQRKEKKKAQFKQKRELKKATSNLQK